MADRLFDLAAYVLREASEVVIQLRPTDLPRLRDDLIAFARTDVAAQLRELDFDEKRLPTEPVADSMKHAVWGLQEGELFYVSAEMAELVEAAARTLPPFVLSADDPPSKAGLAWFARPVMDHDGDDRPVRVVALSWQVTGQTVQVGTYVDRDAYAVTGAFSGGELAKLRHNFPPVFPIGSWVETIRDDGELVPIGEMPGRHLLASAKTMWLLMRQPLASVTTADFGRPARRRAAREGRAIPPVRVIELRRPDGASSSEGGGRQWHHRWIVRGHWRMAACGVGRTERRPVWISPHVKGPRDMPLIGGEKVYAWTR